MAWSTLPTYSDGNILTAAQLNAIAANINESAPAKATATGRIFVSTAANTIAQRVPTSARTTGGAQTTTSTTLTDLTTPGPIISTLATGTSAIFTLSAFCFNTTAGQGAYVGCAVSGATTIAGDLFRSLRIMSGAASENSKQSYVGVFGCGGGTNLTAGNNTFTAKYASTSGAATASFDERELWVLPL